MSVASGAPAGLPDRPSAGPSGAASIGARIERLPLSAWHARTLAIVGTATFFDAFDALAIAFVLPVLAGLWSLKPQEIGLAISIGYLGQMVGAVGIGVLAEAIGRRAALRWAVGLMSAFSLACAFAASLPLLMLFRLLQGIGLGGEVPLAATYINELIPGRARGRMVLLFQALFALGVALTALVALWVIPHLGWQSMFVIGAAPILLLPLLFRSLPESPRWLAGKGRMTEAEKTLDGIEAAVVRTAPLPEPHAVGELPAAGGSSSIAGLLGKAYAGRTLTLWAMLFCTSAVGYGLLTWLPSLYRTVYHLPVSQSLLYGLIGNAASPVGALIGAVFIDRLGRKICFTVSFLGAAAPMLLLWWIGKGAPAETIMILASVAGLFISVLLAGIYVYAPEIYPTRMRALGAGVGTGFYRLAAILSPTAVGFLLPLAGLGAVFLSFGLIAALGALIVILFAVETRGRSLEEIAA